MSSGCAAMSATLIMPTRRSERRVVMPTNMASRRLGGADLVIEAVEEERSTSAEEVGKKMRKSRTLEISC